MTRYISFTGLNDDFEEFIHTVTLLVLFLEGLSTALLTLKESLDHLLLC